MSTRSLSVEYADTGAPALVTAWDSVRAWFVGIPLTGVVALGAALTARGSQRQAALVAAGLVAATVLGTAVAGVVGARVKYDRYPATPDCTDQFDGGPAMPVTRASQQAFEELDHPAPFSGGGSSGIDGCSSELMVRDGEDPTRHYRAALAAQGWTVVTDNDALLRAEKHGQAFDLTVDDVGMWTVWIGPEGLQQRSLEDGQVGPRE